MALPDIYHYDGPTGIYLWPGTADPSPLEPDVWLVPAYATDIAPPATVKEGQQAVFDGDGWYLRDIPEPEPEAPILTPVEE